MENSRDSSAWRNLAVTFGGGLALGAVGMRLTQTPRRPVEDLPRPETDPVAERLARLERRLERIENTPAAPQASPGGVIDQKVLEAVVAAVEARIREHASKLERRFADLEARFAVEWQAMHLALGDKDAARQSAALEVRAELEQELRELRRDLSQMSATQAGVRAEIEMLQHHDERIVDSAEQRFADVRHDYRAGLTELRAAMDVEIARSEESSAKRTAHAMATLRNTTNDEIAVQLNRCLSAVEQSLETRVVNAAAAAVSTQFEEQLTPLRSSMDEKERELTELREKLMNSERSVLDVIGAIGAVCRQAAERVAGGAELPAPVAQAAPETTDPGQFETPPGEATLESSEPAGPVPVPPATAAKPGGEHPTFLQDRGRNSPWRVPLVSSLLITTGLVTGGLYLFHYF